MDITKTYMLAGVAICAIVLIIICLRNLYERAGLKRIESIYDDNKKLVDEMKDYNRQLLEYSNSLGMPEDTETLLKTDGCTRYTGLSFLDTILSYKKLQAEQRGIDVRINAASDVIWNISEPDTVSLLFNLFDNAIQGAGDMKFPFVEVAIAMEDSDEVTAKDGSLCNSLRRVVIDFKNSYQRESETEDFTTTKSDVRSHGFGIPVIREVVGRYKGSVDINADKNIFCVRVEVPE